VADHHRRPVNQHHYQPGYLFVPFGTYRPRRSSSRPGSSPTGVDLILGEIDRVDADANTVHLADGTELAYDQLVIATGTSPRPDQTPGMAEEEWHKSIFDFFTLEGATALRDKLATWEGGRLVVHITEMPIKCPVAPLEFAFLADALFREKGMRDRSRWSTSPRWTARSRSPSPRRTSAACSRTARSRSSPTS
jgi:sulfide:quinone oxidoreductase